MSTKPADDWQKRVLKAREQFLEGVLNPKRKFKITKKDVLRLERRLIQQVKLINKRRF